MPRHLITTLVAAALSVGPWSLPAPMHASADPICEYASITVLSFNPVVVAPPCQPYNGPVLCQPDDNGLAPIFDVYVDPCVPAP